MSHCRPTRCQASPSHWPDGDAIGLASSWRKPSRTDTVDIRSEPAVAAGAVPVVVTPIGPASQRSDRRPGRRHRVADRPSRAVAYRHRRARALLHPPATRRAAERVGPLSRNCCRPSAGWSVGSEATVSAHRRQRWTVCGRRVADDGWMCCYGNGAVRSSRTGTVAERARCCRWSQTKRSVRCGSRTGAG